MLKQKLSTLKNHVHNHRAKYAAGATATVATYFVVKRAEQWNEFLNENDLYDKFYNSDEI